MLLIVAIFGVMVLITGAVVGAIVLTRDDEAAAGEIFLETAGSPGQDPFGALSGPVVTAATSTTATTQATTPTTAAGTIATRTVAGDERGLYGGSLDGGRCDAEEQITFLSANPAIAEAFVSALNRDPTLRWSGGTQVSTAQISSYIRELTPVTLVSDTRVTNYGYRDGRATPRQAVLQQGTAVMVDRYGVPRIKCNCGNPLTQPIAVRSTPTWVGPPWPGFDPTNIVVVNQTNVEINVFVLVNITGEGTIERTAGADGVDTPSSPPPTTPPATQPPGTQPPGTTPPATAPGGESLGTGDVRVTLTWTGDADVDLHVVDPTGFEIYFGSPSSPSGGELDVDDIPSDGDTGTHVENVFWPTGGAPAGAYSAWARNLGGTTGSAAYTLDVFVNGVRVGGSSGTLADGTDSPVTDFSF
ncbi:DUF6777 domain-containing protein [Rhabdothermincola salaria]|uniref:DUF6777 domain-containing protein n=1 Tax=Rhabdothermincola salaria TaxID=2903142 RepID=UPI001E2961A1|nr:DUF6777 domain-containing protein [Rhabdothermincola salaria]MCD9624195.1 hypothetical protein [Rhabdothermincola salaria]